MFKDTSDAHPQHQGFTFPADLNSPEKLASCLKILVSFSCLFSHDHLDMFGMCLISENWRFLRQSGYLPTLMSFWALVSHWRCRHLLSIIYCYGSSSDEAVLTVSVTVLSSWSRGETGIGRGRETHSLATTGTRLMQPMGSRRLLEVVWFQAKLETG